jgi:hypothetical protein
MAEAIDSSLFFSVPTGWMQQYKIGVFGVLYGWNREFRESEHNARERYPGGHLLRQELENSKLYFCAHKRGNSLPRGQGRGRNFDRNQERQKASFSSRLYARKFDIFDTANTRARDETNKERTKRKSSIIRIFRVGYTYARRCSRVLLLRMVSRSTKAEFSESGI